jgi:hypothetical protein
LLNPLSCHATALAREGETPCWAATWPTCADVKRAGEGFGAACGMTDGAGWDALGAASWDPVGSFSAVPICSGCCGSTPFIHASCLTVTPLLAAMRDSVSPGRTVYPPSGPGSELSVEGVPEPVEDGAAGGPPPSAAAASDSAGI